MGKAVQGQISWMLFRTALGYQNLDKAVLKNLKAQIQMSGVCADTQSWIQTLVAVLIPKAIFITLGRKTVPLILNGALRIAADP
jgi:hypothetical protein